MPFDRTAIIHSMLDSQGAGLEIGPSHAPLFPKSAGYNVRTLDYATADQLRVRFADHPGVDAIEEVDYVSDGRPISEIVALRGAFDFIISSHAIEHVTDFVSYFTSCEMLLAEGGVAVLAIPDKRFVFDAFNFPSTTGEMLEAHAGRHRRHASGRIFDFFANGALMDGRPTWNQNDEGQIGLERDLSAAKWWFDRSLNEDMYIDVHAWKFTPASFRLILHDLNTLGLCGLKIDRLEEAGVMEFVVSLSREAPDESISREDLVKAVHREQVLSSLQILNDREATTFGATLLYAERGEVGDAAARPASSSGSGLARWFQARLRL